MSVDLPAQLVAALAGDGDVAADVLGEFVVDVFETGRLSLFVGDGSLNLVRGALARARCHIGGLRRCHLDGCVLRIRTGWW